MILQGRLEVLGIFKIFKIFSKYLRVKLVEIILSLNISSFKIEHRIAIYKGHFIVISTALVTKVSLVNESNPTKEKIT